MPIRPDTIKLTESQRAFRQRVVDYFASRGWTREAGVGIAANIWAECSFRPHVKGDGGLAYGVCQWQQARQRLYRETYGRTIEGATLDEQLAFVVHEMKTSEKKAGRLLSGAQTAREAGAIFSREYERPKLRDLEADVRGALAQKWFDEMYPPQEDKIVALPTRPKGAG